MTIANKKLAAIEQIKNSHNCNGACPKCIKAFELIDKMAAAHLPVEYWKAKKNDLYESNKLANICKGYLTNLQSNYLHGKSLCFIGGHGIGKTFSSCLLLKYILKDNYSGYYTSALDLMNESIESGTHKHMLRNVDFLVVDELDSRFFTSPAQKELFSGIYENIFRFRCQNLLPNILCTNETGDILKVFEGQTIQSIDSLHRQYIRFYHIAGLDVRGEQKCH